MIDWLIEFIRHPSHVEWVNYSRRIVDKQQLETRSTVINRVKKTGSFGGFFFWGGEVCFYWLYFQAKRKQKLSLCSTSCRMVLTFVWEAGNLCRTHRGKGRSTLPRKSHTLCKGCTFALEALAAGLYCTVIFGASSIHPSNLGQFSRLSCKFCALWSISQMLGPALLRMGHFQVGEKKKRNKIPG